MKEMQLDLDNKPLAVNGRVFGPFSITFNQKTVRCRSRALLRDAYSVVFCRSQKELREQKTFSADARDAGFIGSTRVLPTVDKCARPGLLLPETGPHFCLVAAQLGHSVRRPPRRAGPAIQPDPHHAGQRTGAAWCLVARLVLTV